MSSLKIDNWDVLPFCDDPFNPDSVAPRRDPKTPPPFDRSLSRTIPMVPRKCARLNVGHFDPPVFIRYVGKNKNTYQVQQIAEYGAGVWAGDAAHVNEVRGERMVYIGIGDIQIPVKARIAYEKNQFIGIEFLEVSAETRLAIRSHFAIESVAARVSPNHSYGRTEDGYFHKMVFTDKETFEADVLIINQRLAELTANIEFTDTRFRWTGRDPNSVDWSSDGNSNVEETFRQLVGLFQNVRGLNPTTRSAIKSVLRKMRPSTP